MTCGAVSKNLYDWLEVITAQPVSPEHVLNPACKKCSKCTLCLEQGGQTFVERCQTKGFKSHFWRIPFADGGYPYEFDYIVDLQADLLPDNYMASYQRHLALRKAFSVLESEAQAQFTSRLTKGLTKKYWKIF